jgi:hypothetical protein
MICGIDLDFTALKGKLEELKTSAMAEINSTVAAAKAAAQAKMDAFESTIRGWVDELPDLPESEGTPMLAELQSLASDIKALESMVGAELDAATKALALKRAEFEKKFGDALKKAGADLDSLVSGLNGGIDPCSLVPNILTKPDGTVAEVPKKPLYAKDDSLEETPSTETAEMVAVRGKVADDLSVTMASMAASAALVESKLDTIPEKKAQREDILKSQSPDDYYVKTKELEKIDKEVADATTKHPSTELTSFTDTKRGEETITQRTSVFKLYKFKIYTLDKINSFRYDVSLRDTLIHYWSRFDNVTGKNFEKGIIGDEQADPSYSGDVTAYDVDAHIKEIEDKYNCKLHSVKQGTTYVDGKSVPTPVTYKDGNVEAFDDFRTYKFVYEAWTRGE